MKFSMTGQKRWPFNTGDCLIEVTTWTGLTVYRYIKFTVPFPPCGFSGHIILLHGKHIVWKQIPDNKNRIKHILM